MNADQRDGPVRLGTDEGFALQRPCKALENPADRSSTTQLEQDCGFAEAGSRPMPGLTSGK